MANATIITYKRYAKLEYSVHRAFIRLARCLQLSRSVDAFVIFRESCDKAFSKEAGEESSPFKDELLGQTRYDEKGGSPTFHGQNDTILGRAGK